MGNETLVENWNSIIPHKIKVSELEHPTESFVFRCLLSFFRMMKYDMQEFESVSLICVHCLFVCIVHILALECLCLG